jgi:hypothetical protein
MSRKNTPVKPALPHATEHFTSRDCRIKQFETYRSEDKHECNLLSVRVESLLTSQSFLVAAVAIFYRADPSHSQRWEIGIAVVALIVAVNASFAICIGCRMLHMWHRLGNALVQTDNGNWGQQPDPDNYLLGMYLPRHQVDWKHRISMDVFNLAMPIVFGAAWAMFIGVTIHRRNLSIALFAGGLLWIISLIVVWMSIGGKLESRY